MNKSVVSNAINISIRFVIALFAIMFAFYTAKSQTQAFPQIGSQCPSFTVEDLNANLRKLDLASLKGKYAILDFWTVGCVPCVASFAKMDKIQREFQNKLKILLIGRDERNRNVAAFYRKFQKKFNLNLSSAIDSKTFTAFVPAGVPYLVWINREGKIVAITSTEDVTIENVLRFTSDSSFKFTDISNLSKLYTPSIQIGQSVNSTSAGTSNVVFQSTIERWTPGGPVKKTGNLGNTEAKLQKFEVFKLGLSDLYRIAYFGSEDYLQYDYYPVPILNVRDSSIFDESYSVEAPRKFNYFLSTPGQNITGTEIMDMMQEDLKKTFHYDVKIISANMPCVTLVITDRAKLNRALKVSKNSETTKWKIESKKNQINSHPLQNLHELLAMYLPFPLNNLSYNETGLNGTVSLSFSGDIDSLENIRQQLSKVGLDLVPTTKLSRVLRISDQM